MSTDPPTVLCVGEDAKTEKRIAAAFEKGQAGIEIPATMGRSEATEQPESNVPE